jgi:hypothetical protein
LWLWLLSGVPIGLLLWWLPMGGRIACFAALLLLETMHVLSPIMLVWMHEGLRRMMLREPRKYVVLPAAVFLGAALVSIAAAVGWTAYDPASGPIRPHATGWENPFPILFGVYLVWNYYHFSMQNYGVMRLCGIDPGRWGKPVAFIGTALGLKFATLATSANHFITDIGLSWRVSGYRLSFLCTLLVPAPLVFLWSFATPDGTAGRRMVGMVIVLVGMRWGVGFVHFLYSRWVWKLGDPQVRATIARGCSQAQARHPDDAVGRVPRAAP